MCIGRFKVYIGTISSSKHTKKKDGMISEKLHWLQLKAYLKISIALHAKKNTLTKLGHFLLMDLCKVLNINECESNHLFKKMFN
jgi:hypothetical protein